MAVLYVPLDICAGADRTALPIVRLGACAAALPADRHLKRRLALRILNTRVLLFATVTSRAGSHRCQGASLPLAHIPCHAPPRSTRQATFPPKGADCVGCGNSRCAVRASQSVGHSVCQPSLQCLPLVGQSGVASGSPFCLRRPLANGIVKRALWACRALTYSANSICAVCLGTPLRGSPHV